MQIEREVRTASTTTRPILLRPKTGLKDMVAELTPGTKDAGELPEGEPIPVSQTLPDVNLDEILASLDADTRDYLRAAAQRRRAGPRSTTRAASSRRRSAASSRPRSTRARSTRSSPSAAHNITRVVHNFSLLTEELGKQGHAARRLRRRTRTPCSPRWRARTRPARDRCRSCPARSTTTQTTLGKVDRLAKVLGPTLEDLRPGARALGPSLRATRPFLSETTPIIRDEIRPFTRAALPTVKELRPALRDLAAATPDLTRSFKVVNALLNDARLQPAGRARRGLPVLAVVGSTTSADACSRRRTRTARSAAA